MSKILHVLVSPETVIVAAAMQEDGHVPETKPGWRWLPLVEDVEPSFDPATHKAAAGSCLIEEYFARQTWDAIPLNGFELYTNAVQTGFPVTPEGFTLRLEDADRAVFAQMLALVKEALDLGMITNESPQLIADASGQRHEVTTLRFRQIMVGYGLHYKSLWDNLTA